MKQSSSTFGNRSINRRDFLKLGGMGAAGTLLLGSTGCGILGGTQGQQKPLVFATSGGSGTKGTEAWIKAFTKETGMKAVTQAPTDFAKLKSMVEAKQVTWNVLFLTNVQVGNEEQDRTLLEPVDYSIVKAAGIPDNLKKKFGVSSDQYSQVLAYNTKKLKEKPQSWKDYFDVEKFPGKRALGTTVELYFPLEIALMGDGVPKEKLYPLDIDRALAKLDTIRDHLVFYDSASEGQQLLGDGEVGMAVIYHTRAALLEQENRPVKTQWNQNVSVVDFLGVPKGASRVDDSFKLIDASISAKNNYKYTKYNPVAPANRNSFDKVPDKLAKYLPIYGDRLDQALYPDLDWWGANLDEASKRYQQWQLG